MCINITTWQSKDTAINVPLLRCDADVINSIQSADAQLGKVALTQGFGEIRGLSFFQVINTLKPSQA